MIIFDIKASCKEVFFVFKVDKQSVALRLKRVRESKKLSTTDVSRNTGLSSGNLSSWENGKFLPSAEALTLLSELYGVSIDWILKGESVFVVDISPLSKKAEAEIDPDLKEMIDLLQELMHSDDADLRGWAKIQFKNAFKDYCPYSEKKQHA